MLLRKPIHSTGADLRHVDFPGYDNAERPGWDGRVEAGAATPWIPEGKSGWEFGVGKDPRRKAGHDYAARLRSVPADARAECAFVFVTPRNWPGKAAWAGDKQAAGDWKEVRAFDAGDPARIRLAEKPDLPVDRFETLDERRRRWAEASEPALTPAIVAPSFAAYRGPFRDGIEKPPDRPFTVAADSRGEAPAFLACLFGEDGIDARQRDLAAAFDSAETIIARRGGRRPQPASRRGRTRPPPARRWSCTPFPPREALPSPALCRPATNAPAGSPCGACA